MKILQINSSARSAGANSTRLADAVTTRLKAANPGAVVELRDLAAHPHPVLDEAALGALFTPAEQRSPEQAARVALDDALIAQLQSADAIVIGVPMYNFGVPVQLKTWIDAIARAGVTFRYTENGPEAHTLALPPGRHAYVHLARGALVVNGHPMQAGDGARLRDADTIELSHGANAEVLVFDLRPNELPDF